MNPIQTEAEYDAALAEIWQSFDNKTLDEDLLQAITDYEDTHYSIPPPSLWHSTKYHFETARHPIRHIGALFKIYRRRLTQ